MRAARGGGVSGAVRHRQTVKGAPPSSIVTIVKGAPPSSSQSPRWRCRRDWKDETRCVPRGDLAGRTSESARSFQGLVRWRRPLEWPTPHVPTVDSMSVKVSASCRVRSAGTCPSKAGGGGDGGRVPRSRKISGDVPPEIMIFQYTFIDTFPNFVFSNIFEFK